MIGSKLPTKLTIIEGIKIAVPRYLERAELLRHHTVQNRDSRGNFVDRRYPHFTAVLRDRSGTS